ncbi:MAG: hypothetical protein U0736_05250 [Gemmataceae bacterium]
MSTVPPAPAPAIAPPTHPQSVTVVSHSNLFYWWPVWAVGFLMALLTFIEGSRLAVVPGGTIASKQITYDKEKREGYVLPAKDHVAREDPKDLSSEPRPLYVHISTSKNYGVIFCTTLLLVIVITNVPLRGMWSVVVIITVVLLSVIFALAGWWEAITRTLSLLDIRINMGGYLFLSGVLFVVWLVTINFFDKQVYMVFEPGQFKVCTEIGGGEKVYDTIGLTLERQRADLFRHYILGLGSGDLVVRTTGAQAHHFDLPNVLFINKKVQQIEDLLRRQKVVEAK